MKTELMLLIALAFCAVQARMLDIVERPTRNRTAASRVASSPGDALPADSLNCRLVGQYPQSGVGYYGTNNLAAQGSFVYLPASDSGMDILDVSNPASPYVVGRFRSSYVNAVAVDGNYAYAGFGGFGFGVIDIGSPANPTTVGTCALSGWTLGIVKSGNYAYCCCWTGGFDVVDVSNPTAPIRVGNCYAYGARTPAIVGNYAYSANAYSSGTGHVLVINISNPAAPTRVESLATYCAEGIHAVGTHYVFVADGTTMPMVDVSNPYSLVTAGTYYNDSYCFSVDVVGNYAYVACDFSGLAVIDISDTTNPQRAGYYYTHGRAQSVLRSGGYIYMTEEDYGLRIIEFSGDVGVEDGRRPPACRSQLTATIVRGVLFLTGDGRRETGDRSALLDAAGRRVMELQPGPNDVKHLSPGVYFVSSPGSVEKVLLTR